MKRSVRLERISSCLLGVSFWHWAILGLVSPDDAWSVVRWCIAALHVVLGALLIFRTSAERVCSWRQLLACVPALVFGGMVFLLALPTDHWPNGPVLLFAAAASWTIVSFLFLGRSFAVFPSIRKVVARGTYRFVRHPAYLGELGMLAACVWAAAGDTRVWACLAAAVTMIVIRIVVEERVLRMEPRYLAYQDHVRWRLLPLVW